MIQIVLEIQFVEHRASAKHNFKNDLHYEPKPCVTTTRIKQTLQNMTKTLEGRKGSQALGDLAWFDLEGLGKSYGFSGKVRGKERK